MRKSSLVWVPVALLAVSAMVEGSMHARAARQAKPVVATASCHARQLEIDLAGDGRTEQVMLTRIGDESWADVYFAGELRSSTRVGAWHDDAALEAIDVNGDGRTDLVRRWSEGSQEHAQVWLSNGGAFEEGWSGISNATCVASR
jgi:hypothetical protein